MASTNSESESFIRTWAALATVSLGIFVITLDGSMMPVAIGSIVNGLNTQVGFVQAAMALHSLVMASMYLTAGKLADRFGEKRIFVMGAAIFAASTGVAARHSTNTIRSSSRLIFFLRLSRNPHAPRFLPDTRRRLADPRDVWPEFAVYLPRSRPVRTPSPS